jgi:hypothetical protein
MTGPGREADHQRMLLTEFHGRAAVVVEADPDDVYATITAIDRLPEWNARITAVLERPPMAPLTEGVEWVVQMSVPPARWLSRSAVVTHDPERRLFDYVSRSDDGNPSDVLWRWSVSPASEGAVVTVDWTVHPRTFWRRLLFARMRRRQLAGEVPTSLAALAYHSAPQERAP